MPESALRQSLAALSRFFVGDSTLEETLQRVCVLTTEAVPAASLVGITMIVEGQERTAVFTDEAVAEIDQAQYATGEGPWPAFRAAAAAHGMQSTMSLPLVVDKASVGALNLYAPRPRAFEPSDADLVGEFAGHAAIVLANAQAYWDAHSLSERLSEAMQSRAVIEQAKGMLMAAQRCDEETAFGLLVRASQRENVKLRDIAQRIVAAATQRPDPPA